MGAAHHAQKAFEREHVYARVLPGWQTQARRRFKVKLLAATFSAQLIVTLLPAFGMSWVFILLLPTQLVNLGLMTKMRKVSGGRGEILDAELDEFEIAQKNQARSFALSVTHGLIAIPWMVFGLAGLAHVQLDSTSVALFSFTILLISIYTPAMVIVWNRPDPEPDP